MYAFDLAAWFRGEQPATLKQVMALLRGLPDDTSFKAHWQATLKMRLGDDEPADTRTAQEKKFDDYFDDAFRWGHSNQLLAQVVNAVNQNTALTGAFEKNPEFPVVGPSAWADRSEKGAGKGASTARGLFALFGGDPALLGDGS